MAAVHPILADLSAADRDRLESWLVEFDLSWEPGRLPVRVRDLPADSPLRLAALVEMAKIDIERHWQRGRRVTVEDYLRDFPELGTPEGPPLDLVETEWEARTHTGETPDPEEFCRRFPRQCESIRSFHSAETSATPLPQGSIGLTLVAPPVEARTVPDRIGRYRIVRRLGQGGMGTVYLAHDDELDRTVALKVPHFTPGDGPEVRERFRREARAAAALDHPNLCRVYDVGEWDGAPYLTMAFIEGQPLGDAASGVLPPDRIAALLRKVAEALAYAHERGVVHRDLKPSNILVEARGEPVVTDFGLAHREGSGDPRLTRAGVPLGTPAYMSPEQVEGDPEKIGPATDVFSLGVILYELLAGQLPFRGRAAEVMGRIITETPTPPSAHRPGVDPRLEAVCMKALAKEPERRFASMSVMAAALGDRPLPTRQRQRIWAIAGGAALLGVGLILFFSLRHNGVPERERESGSSGSPGGSEDSKKENPTAAPNPMKLPDPTVFAGHGKAIVSVGFAADGKGILSAGEDETVRRWDPETGKEATASRLPVRGAKKFVFSPDGRRVISHFLGTELYDLESRETVGEYPDPGNPHTGMLAYSANGKRIVLAKMSIGGSVFASVWEPGVETKFKFTNHPELKDIEVVALSADGKLGASGAEDVVVRVWEVDSGKELQHWKGLRPTVLAFTPDGSGLLTGDSVGNLVLRDRTSKTGAEVGRFEGHTGRIAAAAFARDGSLLVTGSMDGTARVWDTTKQKELWKLGDHTGGVTCVALSEDRRRVLTGDKDGRVRLWQFQPAEK